MNPADTSAPALLLLVEDDPVSAAFLGDAAALLPARVQVAGSIAEALAVAQSRAHRLVMIDANLPDGRGEDLLLALRAQGMQVPALAHTAARDPALHRRLLAAGFVDVLCKPLGVAELHAALRPHLPAAPACASAHRCWDDAAALAALGSPAHVQALRTLFLRELPAQRERIERAAAAGETDALRAELHRLAASCGFVGAAALAEAVRSLQGAPADADGLQRLREAIDALPRGADAGAGETRPE